VDDAGLIADVVVRPARPEELAECAQIYVRVLSDTFTWMPADRHREEDFLKAAREEEVFVALDGDRILGIAAFYRPQTFLHSLYVTERGRGVGKLLLDHVIAAAGGGRLSLKCQAANLRAQAFYIREGFRCTEAGEDGGVAWLRFVRA
jgi:GNAT superfamily N-acetyltransferase